MFQSHGWWTDGMDVCKLEHVASRRKLRNFFAKDVLAVKFILKKFFTSAQSESSNTRLER